VLSQTGLFGSAVATCFGQGIANRKTRVQPRSKLSGMPFGSRFIDMASQSGVRTVTAYGGIDHKDYIVETHWMRLRFLRLRQRWLARIFLLSGTRLTIAP
jgi:hypothetical protein